MSPEHTRHLEKMKRNYPYTKEYEQLEWLKYHPDRGLTVLLGSAAVSDVFVDTVPTNDRDIAVLSRFDNHSIGRLTMVQLNAGFEQLIESNHVAWQENANRLGEATSELVIHVAEKQSPTDIDRLTVPVDQKAISERQSYHRRQLDYN